jgi:hypothetical protein
VPCEPIPSANSDFAATSALLLFVVFIAGTLAAAYFGHMMAS